MVPQVPEDYIQRGLKKIRETSSLSLGFRLSGLQVHGNKESGFWKPEREVVWKLTADGIQLVLRKLVSSNSSADPYLVPDSLFASSVYGGAEVKLIDFAHVLEGNGVIDHNFLDGVCSFIKFISEILTTPDECSNKICLQDSEKSRVCNADSIGE
ncbi:hypothetical protein GH714_025211 [Hevea brasiliensis]|uniref:Inositol polyphosphate multikinase n=1 Tax=Hevea brasiliensis TaxID=3981 RepID=A0A6A6MHI7_HEVBR|nr:hypothetical protein GH714_025211 [Hevea brasiliensis]